MTLITSSLDGMKVAILVTDGFEQVELTGPRKALDGAGAHTQIVSPKDGSVRGWNHHDPADTFEVDVPLKTANPDDFDALLLPGGVVNPDALRIDEKAAMAGLHATLTLPGIAGIVLTIGMAVDTNILIFERIREELRSGKTVRAAIDAGFARAFRTVIDTHVTVLVSAAILYQFGTGPVKGFAVSLAIGILASLFTAVFFTRLVFDLIYMGSRRVESISI